MYQDLCCNPSTSQVAQVRHLSPNIICGVIELGLTHCFQIHILPSMSNITGKRVSFDKFTYKDALRILPDWHTTMRPLSPVTGDFQLRFDLKDITTVDYSDWLCLNVYKEKRLAILSEYRNGYLKPASEIPLPLIKEVIIKVDPTNPEKSELIFESENFNYSISNKGLTHKLTNKEGESILNKEFEIGVPFRER
jgi:hypothetical protein